MAEREVKIVIRGEDRSKKALASGEKNWKRFGKNISGFIGGAVKALAKLGAAAAVGIGIIGVTSIKTAIEVESAFAGIIKTTDGLVDEFGALNAVGEEVRAGFRALALEIPTNLPDLMQVGELGGQLGIAREHLVSFTATIAALGEATNLTREQAATAFAQIANIMGTSQQDFDRMGSSIVALGNNFATTEADIVNFSQRISAAGRIAGLTEADVFGIAAAFSSVGVQAEAGGTAVQKVLTAMTKAVSSNTGELIDNSAAIGKGQSKLTDLEVALNVAQLRMGEFTEKTKESSRVAAQARIDKLTRQIAEQSQALVILRGEHGKMSDAGGALETFAEVAGLTADEFKVAFEEDAAGAFTAFVEGLGEQGDEAFKTLETLKLEDQRLVRAFLSLAGAGDLLEETIQTSNLAWEENTALAKEAQTRYGTFESKLKILKNTVSDVALTIGDVLKDKLEDALDAAMPFIQEFAENLPEFLEEKLIPALDTVLTNIGKVAAVIGTFVADLQAGTPFMEAFKKALFFLIPADVANKILGIAQNIADFVTAASTFVTEHAPALQAAFIAIGAAIAVASIASAIAGIIAAINPISLIIGAIGLAIGLLAAAWVENWGDIQGKVAAVWLVLEPIFESVKTWLGENIPVAVAALNTAWNDTLLPALQAMWAFIKDFLLPIWIALLDLGLTIVGQQFELLAELWTTTLKPALDGMWKFLKDKIVPKLDAAATSFGGISGAVEKVLKWIADFKKTIEAIKLPSWLKPGSASPLENSLTGIAGALIEVTGSFIDFAKSIDKAESTTFKNVGKGINKLTGALKNLAEVSVLLSQAGGAGAAPNIGQFLELFETLLIPTMNAIDVLVERFGEKTIKKLRKSAKRMREIIEAVIFDMSAIALAELPDMGMWRDQIIGVTRAVIEALQHLEFEFKVKGLESAAEWATSVKGILAIVKPAVDALAALLTYESPEGNILDLAASFAEDLFDLVWRMQSIARNYEITFETDAAKWWASVKAIVGTVKPGVDALTALFAYESPEGNILDLAAAFTEDLLDLVWRMQGIARNYEITFEEGASTWWASVKNIIGIVKPGIDALTALFTYESPEGNILDLAAAFTADLLDLVWRMQGIARNYEIVYEAGASAWWASVQAIVGAVKPGVDALAALFTYESPEGNILDLAAAFTADLLDLVWRMQGIASNYEIEFKESAKAWWANVQAILGIVRPGIDALAAMLDFVPQANLAFRASQFAAHLLTVVEQFTLVKGSFQITFAEDVKEWWASVTSIVGVIKPGVDALKAILDFAPQSNLPFRASQFAAHLLTVVEQFTLVKGSFQITFAEDVKEWWAAVQSIIGIVEPGIKALASLMEFTAVEGLKEKAAAFADDLAIVVTELDRVAQNFITVGEDGALSGLEAAERFGEAAGKIVGFIAPAIKALASLGTLTETADLPGKLNIFTRQITQVLTAIQALAAAFAVGGTVSFLRPGRGGSTQSGLEAAKTFAGAVGTIASGVKGAIDLIDSFMTYKGRVIAGGLATFAQNMLQLRRMLIDEAASMLLIIPKANSFKASMITISGAIKTGLDTAIGISTTEIPALSNLATSVAAMLDAIVNAVRVRLGNFFNIGFAMGRSLAQGIISGLNSGLANASSIISGIVPAQHGFSGVVTRPTLFLAGEAGPESVNITPGGGAQGGIHIQNLNVQGSGNAGADVANTIRMLEFGTVSP